MGSSRRCGIGWAAVIGSQNDELFRKELKFCQTEWKKQSQEMEKIVKEVEGEDDRTYEPIESAAPAESKKQQ